MSAAVSPAAAGWVIEESDPDFPGDSTYYYFSDGRVRVEGLVEGLVFLVDPEAGEGYILDEAARKFAGGKLEAVVTALHGEEEGDEDNGDPSPAAVPPLRIERITDEESVAGFRTEHYRIFQEDILVEDLWISPEIDAETHGSGGSLFFILEAMTGGGVSEEESFLRRYEENPSYRDVSRSGYPVRRVVHFVGEHQTIEVRRAQRRDLPSASFSVPDDFSEASYKGVFFNRD